MFFTPEPNSSNDFRRFSFAFSSSSPVYSSVAFAVNPFSYRLFRTSCDLEAPATVSRRIFCTGSPVIPSNENDVLKCITSSVPNTYCFPCIGSVYTYHNRPTPANNPASSTTICTQLDCITHRSSILISPPYFFRLNTLRIYTYPFP